MKKAIALVAAVLVLAGCKFGEEEDSYSKKQTLTPAQVNALHEICKSQPNYDTSWVVVAKGEAKGVVCRYRDIGVSRIGERGRQYTIDAEILRIKIQEGLK